MSGRLADRHANGLRGYARGSRLLDSRPENHCYPVECFEYK